MLKRPFEVLSSAPLASPLAYVSAKRLTVQAVQAVPAVQAVQAVPGLQAPQAVPGPQSSKAVPGPQAPQSSQSVQTVPGSQALQAILGRYYRLPLASLNEETILSIKKELTLTRTAFMDSKTSEERFYLEHKNYLYMPRNYGLKRFPDIKISKNSLSVGTKAFNCESHITLDDTPDRPQVRAFNSIMQHFRTSLAGCVCSMHCGAGKTKTSFAVAHALKVKTLFLSNRSPLFAQSMAVFEKDFPGGKTGSIQGDVFDVDDKDMVFGMLQTFVSRCDAWLSDAAVMRKLGEFGFVIIDEAHHMASQTFSDVIPRLLGPRYLLGLSATFTRKDSMDSLLHWYVGSIVFASKRPIIRDPTKQVRVLFYNYWDGNQKEYFLGGKNASKKTYHLPLMLRNIYKDSIFIQRLSLLLQREISPEVGREDCKILLLSPSVVFLKALMLSLPTDVQALSGLYIGEMKKEERLLAQTTKQILLAQVELAGEGFDDPSRRTLFIATPRGDIVQNIGRIMRGNDHKYCPKIIEIRFPYSLFAGFAKKHASLYETNRYHMQYADLL